MKSKLKPVTIVILLLFLLGIVLFFLILPNTSPELNLYLTLGISLFSGLILILISILLEMSKDFDFRIQKTYKWILKKLIHSTNT